MSSGKHSWLLWLFYFIVFELIVFFGLQWLLSGMGMSNQLQPENTVVPNWVKAVTFILLYILLLLFMVMLISNTVPSKHRTQLMRWVYLALIGMVVMLFLLF
ncbi:hypothetical protein CLV24_103162 [Pontibacter ummariensis]|uniref:Uncharacterized protein n=1 Tax=Pontibacter ummariensis TaxID=1610492 RepID=A0A239CNP4_9BACT|nr:hypothetical protein [Pontibacter ummariensis]PRY14923.1 hypothetical protein CLV24_103162 [Pontibacter ummariensis]SNS21492.1 hypothetical protein SAMN06296052_103151 [Pontibacter ummariensis]